MKVIRCSKYWPLFWFGAGAITLGKYVFMRKDLFLREIIYSAVVAHEAIHVQQQSKEFLLWWLTKYAILPSFRRKMELEAYGTEYLFCRDANSHGLYNFDLSPESWAKRLVGITYGWMINYEEALDYFKSISQL